MALIGSSRDVAAFAQNADEGDSTLWRVPQNGYVQLTLDLESMHDARQPNPTAVIPRSAAMTWLAIALAVTVFALDLILLHGQGEAVLYVIVVLIFLWSTHWPYVLLVAAACSLMTIAGFVLSPAELSANADNTNHVFSFVAIWLTAILGLRMNRLAEKLAASEARTRTIVETAAEGIITIDEKGTVESFNEAAASIFGYDIAEIIGQNVKILMPPNYRDAHEQGLARYLDTGEQQIIGTPREFTGLRKDGTTFPLLIAVNEMYLQQRLFAGIVLDMTELRVAQDRAVQAQRLAAIGEAMTGLTHESRNALQRSQAAVEMLARKIGDQADAMDLLGRIQAAQDDLHSLYEEVRGYAAPICIQTEPCRVDSLVEVAWEKVREARPERNVQLDQTGTHIDLTCDLDPFPIRRVIRNIIDNSLDAIEGPVRITVNYSETNLDGRPAIEVSLRDNGPGLDEETRQKLFEPFFTTKTSGTGLGMPIARRYVEAHGGVIDVPENSGQGAEFRIILPRTQS